MLLSGLCCCCRSAGWSPPPPPPPRRRISPPALVQKTNRCRDQHPPPTPPPRCRGGPTGLEAVGGGGGAVPSRESLGCGSSSSWGGGLRLLVRSRELGLFSNRCFLPHPREFLYSRRKVDRLTSELYLCTDYLFNTLVKGMFNTSSKNTVLLILVVSYFTIELILSSFC